MVRCVQNPSSTSDRDFLNKPVIYNIWKICCLVRVARRVQDSRFTLPHNGLYIFLFNIKIKIYYIHRRIKSLYVAECMFMIKLHPELTSDALCLWFPFQFFIVVDGSGFFCLLDPGPGKITYLDPGGHKNTIKIICLKLFNCFYKIISTNIGYNILHIP